MVGIGALTPAESFAAIDHDTILLLFAMMLLITYLERGGLFERIALGGLLLARTPYYRRRLPAGPIVSVAAPAPVAPLAPLDPMVIPVALLVVAGFLAGAHLGYAALAGALVFVVRDREPPEVALARVDWSLLAGNLTLLGSVANLIVAEQARRHHELGFFEYLRFGAISTLVVLPVTVAILWCELLWRGA